MFATARHQVADIIGMEAEAIVFCCCGCDRALVWPRFGKVNAVKFRDRFTSTTFLFAEPHTRDFGELTVANEIEIAINSAEIIAESGA